MFAATCLPYMHRKDEPDEEAASQAAFSLRVHKQEDAVELRLCATLGLYIYTYNILVLFSEIIPSLSGDELPGTPPPC